MTSPDCSDVPGKVAPVIDRNRCEGSGGCVRVCPFKVFELRTACRLCIESCPEKALALRPFAG